MKKDTMLKTFIMQYSRVSSYERKTILSRMEVSLEQAKPGAASTIELQKRMAAIKYLLDTEAEAAKPQYISRTLFF